MKKKRAANSIRKFIRKEKARIRREYSDTAQAETLIQELVSKQYGRYNNKK